MWLLIRSSSLPNRLEGGKGINQYEARNEYFQVKFCSPTNAH
jgi:hypothetical protein